MKNLVKSTGSLTQLYLNNYTPLFEKVFLVLLLLISAFLRLLQLGYSDFYGDETKVFFLRKDTSAVDFLLNQRKGPVQFVVSWFMEKVVGTYDEFWTRLPFALAGIAAVLVLYLLVKEIYGRRIAGISALLFSLNGFFIAFSRTVQYQSFLVLFGLGALLFTFYYIALNETMYGSPNVLRRRIYLLCIGVFLALAYLSHWDAVFYDVAVALLFIDYLIKVKNADSTRFVLELKNIAVFLVFPFLAIIAVYFVPYISGGYLEEHFIGYLSRRLEGSNQLPNNSSYTFWLYNPDIVYYIPYLFIPFLFFTRTRVRTVTIIIFLWFLVPFVTFQFFVASPGTHIQNYFIPLIILSSLGLVKFYNMLSSRIARNLAKSMFLFLLIGMLWISIYSYVPSINTGYPWKDSTRGPLSIAKLDKESNQYFIYGFPYNRGWRQIRDYINDRGGVRSFYTNDNVTIGEYYLHGIPAYRIHPQKMPQYYINIINNQEFNELDPIITATYSLEKEFFVDDELVAQIYKFQKQ